MTKKLSTQTLQVDKIIVPDGFDGNVEVLPAEKLVDEPPHLVFLISGIRTAGMWVQDAIDAQFTTSAREIIFKRIQGNGKSGTGRLSSWRLVTRIGLEGYRKSFLKQIKSNLRDYPTASVSIFAHSLGSSIFADIAGETREVLEKQGREIENLVFLGSICHRKHSESLKTSCLRFINDVGVLDMWSFRASVVRPCAYSDVGLWGFLDGYPKVERYFWNDHTSCTSIEHMKEKLIPLLDIEDPIPLGIKGARPSRPDHQYHYFKRGLHIMFVVFSMISLMIFFTVGFIWGLVSFFVLICFWVLALWVFR